jgi:hypothetical protein
MKRITTIEYDRVKITTRRKRSYLWWCESCQAQAKFVSQAEAFELAGAMRMLGLTVNRENLHFYQPRAATQVLVCVNSILNGGSFKNQRE